MTDRSSIQERIASTFTKVVFAGVAAPHDCPECGRISTYLKGKTWGEVTGEFVDEYGGSLPLLTLESFSIFIPSFLWRCLEDPQREGAQSVVIHLCASEQAGNFSQAQRTLIRDAALNLIENNGWGSEDESNVVHKAEIERNWK